MSASDQHRPGQLHRTNSDREVIGGVGLDGRHYPVGLPGAASRSGGSINQRCPEITGVEPNALSHSLSQQCSEGTSGGGPKAGRHHLCHAPSQRTVSSGDSINRGPRVGIADERSARRFGLGREEPGLCEWAAAPTEQYRGPSQRRARIGDQNNPTETRASKGPERRKKPLTAAFS